MKKILVSLLLVFALSSSVFAKSFDIPTKLIIITTLESYASVSVTLKYDNVTKIVYLCSRGAYGNYSVQNYYSSNGKLCKYDETSKKLVEIE